MLYIYRHLLSIIIISSSIIISSEKPLVVYASGQKNLYTQKDLTTTACSNLSEAICSYEKGDYRSASLLITGVQQYINIMNMPPLDSSTCTLIDFIKADCHIKLKSPQHAISAFKQIYDQKIEYGIITCRDIANSLYKKANTLDPNNKLAIKLTANADYFNTISNQQETDKRITLYKKEYDHYSSDQLIDKLRTTRDQERLTTLFSYITKAAENGNLRALCIMTMAYNLGLYGITPCPQKALSYAHQYIVLLANKQQPTPLEHFSIQKTLYEHGHLAEYPIQLYHDLLNANAINNTHKTLKVLNELKFYNNNESQPRNISAILLTNINNNTTQNQHIINDIQKIELQTAFTTQMNSFIATEGDIIIPLLQTQLLDEHAPKASINYFLGLIFYHKKDYIKAKKHFVLSTQALPNLLTQYKIFNCNHHADLLPIIDSTNQLIELIKQTNAASKKINRNKAAHALLCSDLLIYSKDYIGQLFKNNNYELADELIALILQEKKTAAIAIQTLIEITTNHQLNNQKISPLFTISHLPKTFKKLHYFNTEMHSASVVIEVAQLLIDLLNKTQEINDQQKNITINQILTYLHTTEKNSLLNKNLCPKIAHAYYSLGQQYNKIEYYNSAILYGNKDAYYAKACLLKKQQCTKKTEYEIVDLLNKNAESDSVFRSKSLYKLGKLYFNYLTQENYLQHIPCNNAKAFDYLSKATISDNNPKAIQLLATLYSRGIKQNEQWLLEPNINKADNLFKQASQQINKPMIEILFARAITHYKNNSLDQSLQDFLNITSSDSPYVQINSLLCSSLVQLKTTNDEVLQILALQHLDLALNNSALIDFSVIDSATESLFDQKTSSIINFNNTSPCSILWCYLTGKMYCEMTKNTDTMKQKRAYGIQCLQHSAKNNCYKSQKILGCLPEKDIAITESISYLFQAYIYAKNNNLRSQEISVLTDLKRLIPDSIIDQYLLFEHYSSRNNFKDALALINNLFIIKQLIVKNNERNDINQIIERSSTNIYLQELARKFINSPESSTFADKSAAVLLGCLYSCSSQKTDLLKSIKYLEEAQKINFFKELNAVISESYYCIGLIHKNENNHFLSIEYLKKSASHYNHKAIYLITQEWLNNNPLVASIPSEQIENYLTIITTIYSTKEAQRLYNKFLDKKSTLNQEKITEISNKELTHPYLQLLTNTVQSDYSNNKQFQEALKHHNKTQLKTLKKLAKNNHPHACFLLAALHHSDVNAFNEYLLKGLLRGIVKKQRNNSSVFIDGLLLSQINNFIKLFIQSKRNTTTENQILSNLMQKLTDAGINISYFKQFLLDTQDFDLDCY